MLCALRHECAADAGLPNHCCKVKIIWGHVLNVAFRSEPACLFYSTSAYLWGGVGWGGIITYMPRCCHVCLHCTTYVMRRCCYVLLHCTTYVILGCCYVLLHCTTYVILRCCYVVLRCSTYVMLRCCSVPLHCSLALYHIRHATLLLVAVIHTSCYAAALFPCTVPLHCSTYVMLRCCYVLKTKDAKYPDCMNQKILQHV